MELEQSTTTRVDCHSIAEIKKTHQIESISGYYCSKTKQKKEKKRRNRRKQPIMPKREKQKNAQNLKPSLLYLYTCGHCHRLAMICWQPSITNLMQISTTACHADLEIMPSM